MENAHNWDSNEFHKVKNGNQSVSISFQEPPCWTSLGTKMKLELYVSSVTAMSFSFSELRCHAVTLTLLLPSSLLQATLSIPFSSSHTAPKPESHFHIFSLLKHLSFIFLPSKKDHKAKPSQSELTRHHRHVTFLTSSWSLICWSLMSMMILAGPTEVYAPDFPLLLFHWSVAETEYHSRRSYNILLWNKICKLQSLAQKGSFNSRGLLMLFSRRDLGFVPSTLHPGTLFSHSQLRWEPLNQF